MMPALSVTIVRASQSAPRHPRRSFGAAEATFGALLTLGAAIVLYETRGLSFLGDEWDFLLDRRGLSTGVLLRPHGPHLSLIPILIYKAVLALFGARSYVPFRLLAALDLAFVALVLGWACRALWGRWWGLAPVLLIVTLGPGGATSLWPFQVGYAIATAAGIVALVAIGRGGRRADMCGCAALIVSLASASQGVGFIVGAALMIALRPRRLHRAWVVALPALLYGLWYAKYGAPASETELSLWRHTPSYLWDSLTATLTGLVGKVSPGGGRIPLDDVLGDSLAVAGLAACLVALVRGWRPRSLFWAVVTTLLALWVAQSLSNTPTTPRAPNEARYLFSDVALLLICICAAVPRPRPPLIGALGATILLVAVAVANTTKFTQSRSSLLAADRASRAQVGALLILRGTVPAGFVPAPPGPPGVINNVQAGPFFSAVDSFGMIADSVEALAGHDRAEGNLADAVLARGEVSPLSPSPTGPLRLGATTPAIGHAAPTAHPNCVTQRDRKPLVVVARPGSYALIAAARAPLAAALGRFAHFDARLGVVAAGRAATFTIAPDRAPQLPWRLEVTGAGASVCTLTAP